MPEDDERKLPPLRLNINPEGLVKSFTHPLTRLYTSLTLAVNLAPKADEKDTKVNSTDSHVRLTWADDAQPFSSALEDFKAWTLANALRDAIELYSAFLEQARDVVVTYGLHGRDKVTPSELEIIYGDDRVKFHKLGFPAKLKSLQEDYPKLVPEFTYASLVGINRARNCLVHRRGVVTGLDLYGESSLVVEWMGIDILLVSDNGERPMMRGVITREGERVVPRRSKRTKTFSLRDRVHFDLKEFSEIAFTMTEFARETAQRLLEIGKEAGIQVTGGGAPQDGD
jgi:hypothetical protein